MEVGLGVTANAELLKLGDGNVLLGSSSGLPTLVGDGMAGESNPIIATNFGAAIIGAFNDTLGANGAPIPFFLGSDIVTANYTATATTIAQVTASTTGSTTGPVVTVSTNGTFSGFTAQGDKITVTSAITLNNTLVVLQDPHLGFSIVERGTSTAANTLTVTTTASAGNGISQLNGIAVASAGAVTIVAANSDLLGTIRTAGTLTALTLHNIGVSSDTATNQISDGGTGPTTITAREVFSTNILLDGPLSSLTATSVDVNSSLTALSFGSIKTTGGSMYVTGTGLVLDPGNFAANLTSTTQNPGATFTVVGSATIAGNLLGTWDVGGNIGSVAAASVGNSSLPWNLGTPGGANTVNGGLLGGGVGTVTASTWEWARARTSTRLATSRR